jgi:hypothetical protein
VEESDPQKFCNAFHMTSASFVILLEKVKPYIEKIDTQMRQAIPARVRPMIVVRYVTTAANFHVLEDIFRVSYSTISLIVPEVCSAIWESMAADFLKCPNTKEDWKEKADRFQGR